MNYYKASPEKPFHVSVGALVINESREVMCHHYDKLRGRENIYLLMRETIHPNDSLEATLQRGLIEEFGAKATVVTYLGSIVARDPWYGEMGTPVEVEKTTLYFLMTLDGIDESLRDKEHPETGSVIEFHTFDFLRTAMKQQQELLQVQDINESAILDRAQIYLETKK